MGIMAEQAKHDQVCVQAIQTMPGIRIAERVSGFASSQKREDRLVRLSFGQPNEFLNLVLPFSWHLNGQRGEVGRLA